MPTLPAFIEIAGVRFLAKWADPAVGTKISATACLGIFRFVLPRNEHGGYCAGKGCARRVNPGDQINSFSDYSHFSLPLNSGVGLDIGVV